MSRDYQRVVVSDIDGVVVDYIFNDPGALKRTPEFMKKLESLRPRGDIIAAYKKLSDMSYVFYFVTGRSSNDEQLTRAQLSEFRFKYKLRHVPYRERAQYINEKKDVIEKIIRKYKKIIVVDDDKGVHDAVNELVARYDKKHIINVLYPRDANIIKTVEG